MNKHQKDTRTQTTDNRSVGSQIKKILLLIPAIIICFGTYAQNEAANKENVPHLRYIKSDSAANSYPDGYMMKDGLMMEVNNGKFSLMEQDYVLSNGTQVMSNGNYLENGGIPIMFKEGEHMDLHGRIFLRKEYRSRGFR